MLEGRRFMVSDMIPSHHSKHDTFNFHHSRLKAADDQYRHVFEAEIKAFRDRIRRRAKERRDEAVGTLFGHFAFFLDFFGRLYFG